MRTIITTLIMLNTITLMANTGKDATIDSLQSANVLKEVVVKYKKHQVLHILAYVRDYSTLSSYSDTITLYREKWVDFMLPTKANSKYEGWRSPRVLKAKSYYRFTNAFGLDSVSNECNQYFSWSDWVGIIDDMDVPTLLQSNEITQDTVFGKFGASEIWTRRGDDINLKVDVLADTLGQKWVPDFSLFFRDRTDFERFKITYDFRDVYKRVYALDLTGISCEIESRGRGRDMFMFNRRDEPFFVSTHADFYIVDKEFMTVSEAKKWREKNVDDSYWPILPPGNKVPEHPADMSDLIARVESIDHNAIRLGWKPDPLVVPKRRPPIPLHKRYFKLIKSLIGL